MYAYPRDVEGSDVERVGEALPPRRVFVVPTYPFTLKVRRSMGLYSNRQLVLHLVQE